MKWNGCCIECGVYFRAATTQQTRCGACRGAAATSEPWRANLGAGFALAGLAAALVGVTTAHRTGWPAVHRHRLARLAGVEVKP